MEPAECLVSLLPEELLEGVFSFFDVGALCALRLVCHQWRRVIDWSDMLWRSAHYRLLGPGLHCNPRAVAAVMTTMMDKSGGSTHCSTWKNRLRHGIGMLARIGTDTSKIIVCIEAHFNAMLLQLLRIQLDGEGESKLCPLLAARSDRGEDVLDVACAANNDIALDYLLPLFKEGVSPHRAARMIRTCLFNGNVVAAALLLRGSTDVKAIERFDIRSLTPHSEDYCLLSTAVSQNRIEAVELLLQAGFSPLPTVPFRTSPLYLASACGSVDVLERLLRTNSQFEERDHRMDSERATARDPETGASLLMLAVAGEHYACAELLLDSGADAHTRLFGTGETALHLAAARGSIRIIELLLASSHEIDINKRSKGGATPLQLALQGSHLGAAEVLVRNGATTVIFDSLLGAHVSVEESICRGGACVSSDVAPRVLENVLIVGSEFDVNAQSSQGSSLLWHSVEQRDLPIMRSLLRLGANVNAPASCDFSTPLLRCIASDWAEGVSVLIEAGAHVEDGVVGCDSPLSFACATGASVEILELLVVGGADVCAESLCATLGCRERALIPLVLRSRGDWKAESCDAAIAKLGGCSLTPVQIAMLRADVNALDVLVLGGADICPHDIVLLRELVRHDRERYVPVVEALSSARSFTLAPMNGDSSR